MRIGEWKLDLEKGKATRVISSDNLEIFVQPSKADRKEAERRLIEKGIIVKGPDGKVYVNEQDN